MKSKQIRVGAILSYAQIIVGIVVSLIYTPAMLHILGKAEYGVYSIASSTVSYLNLFNMGFGSSYVRYYFKDKADGLDTGKTNGLFFSIFLVLSTLAFVCGLVIIKNVEYIFASGLTDSEYVLLKKIMYILTITTTCNLATTLFSSVITAHEKFVFQKTLNLLKTILSPCTNWIFLCLGYRSVAMALITAVLSIGVDILNVFYCIFSLKIKITLKKLDFKRLKTIGIFASFVAFNIIIEQLNWNVDKLILGRMKGAAVTAVYSLSFYIHTLYTQVGSSVYTMYIPEVNKLVAEGNNQKAISNLFIRIGRIQAIILLPVLLGFVFFGKQFVAIWAPAGYEDVYYIVLLLIGPITISYIQNIGIPIQTAMNKHIVRAIVYSLMAIINVFLSIPLVKLYGAIGSALGTAITVFFANGIFMNIYYQKAIGIDIISFWKSMVDFVIPIIVCSIFGSLIMKFAVVNSYMSLIFYAFIFCIVYVISICFFSLNVEERAKLKSIKNRIPGRK